MQADLRLFTALPLPAENAKQLEGALPRNLGGARWVPADDFHVTLRFLGDVPEVRLPAIMDALEGVRRKAFGVEIAGLGVFAGRDEHILYAPVISVRAVTDLCAQITDRLQVLGFDFGARPFVPHVTLARVPVRADIDKYIKINNKKIHTQFRADHFSLYQSGGLTGGVAGGARYVPRGEWALAR